MEFVAPETHMGAPQTPFLGELSAERVSFRAQSEEATT
jgi:hypothetical protein